MVKLTKKGPQNTEWYSLEKVNTFTATETTT